jgi:TolB-like protein/Tfp pilus assembly protein PilF
MCCAVYNCARMALAIGTKLGPYVILAPLGAGGMGEVYRATDTKLGRDIALKVLPAEMAQDLERLGRFRREAKVLAQLDHPNIVTIHSVEEADGIHFLTMQLVEGLPLDRLIPAGGLPVEQIFEIASALGDALAAAHEKGIVHRDLKPANVMVSNEGRVKVLDFGLAKDIRAANLTDATMTSDSRTQIGVVMGTPAYMSPEQTSGRPLDHRTDIFSMGVVLHEMATGQRPFEGSSSAELVSAILRDNPPSVTDVRPDLPSDLARIVRRCLEKDPRHRVQTARDVSNEFRDLARQTSQKFFAAKASTTRAISTADSGGVRADEGFWVAVLPFRYGGSNADLSALADGLTDDIITGLSKFSYLRVIARSSSSRYAGQSVDVRSAGKELSARYVMEGTLRQAGSRLRLAVQLVDTVSGAHLWAENYERSFSPETIFELQDDLVPRMASTVADMNGILPRSMSEGLRSRPPEQLSPYEAVLRSFAYTYSATPEELTAARSGLEEAVRKAPAYADAWAMLSFLCAQDYVHGYELQANALEIATSAARRAVALGPSNHLAYFSLSQALWSQKDYDSFRDAAERAVLLNPMDGNSVAYLGELLIYAGSAERGMQLVERAKQLNPNHPGWYWFADFYHAYSQGDYRNAQSFALKAKLRGNPLAPMFLAAACGQLGDVEGGAKAAAELVKFRPELPALMRKQVAKVWNREYGERFLEGLRRAGLKMGEDPGKPTAAPSAATIVATTSGEARAALREDEGFWVAALPFKYASSSADLKALAEGISEEIVAGLSRFSYLRVITSGSTQRYLDQSLDLRAVGKELGARYVVSGNLRQMGARLRVAAQLVDAASGAQLWSETYERPFSVETVFELQDDLAARVAATVGDAHGILAHSMSEALRDKPADQLTPYEAVLRSFGYGYRQTPEEHAAVRDALELAVEKAPSNADAWSMLSRVYMDEFAHGTNLRPDALGRMLHAARRAVDAAPSSALAYGALAYAMFFRKEFQAFRTAAEQSIALNPLNSPTVAGMGALMAYTGDWERGCALVERAMQLNPRHPGWYWIPFYCNAYRKGDYRGAVNFAIKFNLPGFHVMHEALAAAYGQLGEHEKAAESLREIFRLKPDYGTAGRQRLEKWFDPEFATHMIDGLRKAGLKIPDAPSLPPVKPAETVAKASTIPSTVTPSIAVLPFANMSADKDQEYFSDGLAEEIINLLAHIPGLKVIARTSAFAFRGKEQDIRGIADALGVTHVLEGSVRRSGDRIRVTAQLIHAADGAHLWSERFDRDLKDVFAIQDEIGQAISEALKVRLTARAQSVNLDAYQNYLRGRHQVLRLTKESLEKGREHLEQALTIDPNYAQAYAALAEYYHCLWILGIESISEIGPLVKSAAEKALSIDPTNSEAHSLLASMAGSFDYDWKKAKTHHHQALSAEPISHLARFRHVTWYLLPLGRVEEALDQSRLALESDPLNIIAYYGMSNCLDYARRYQETIDCARKALEIDPNSYLMWSKLGRVQNQLGLTQEAILSLQRVVEIVPWWPIGVGALAAIYYQSGDHERSKEWARKLSGLKHNAYASAIFHAATGNVDAMFAALDEAYQQRDVFLLHVQAHPFFDPYHANPRFHALLQKMNLE